jgi:hypothetical protein
MNRIIQVVCLGCLLPFAALADRGDLPTRTSGFYLGAGGGYSQINVDSESGSTSSGQFAYKLLGGYRYRARFLPWGMSVALEGAYLDLGESSDTTSSGSQVKLDVSGFEGYLVGYLPIGGNFDLMGKVGAFAADSKLTVDGAQQSDDSSTELAMSIGVAYQTGGPFAAQFELEGFDAHDGLYVATISGLYHFK